MAMPSSPQRRPPRMTGSLRQPSLVGIRNMPITEYSLLCRVQPCTMAVECALGRAGVYVERAFRPNEHAFQFTTQSTVETNAQVGSLLISHIANQLPLAFAFSSPASCALSCRSLRLVCHSTYAHSAQPTTIGSSREVLSSIIANIEVIGPRKNEQR